MRVVIPHQKTPWLEGKDEQVNRSWFQWLRQLWWASGLAKEVPMYGDLYYPGTSLANAQDNLDTLATNLKVRAMDNAAATTDYYSIRLPNNYREGTDLGCYVDWVALGAGSGTVILQNYYATAEADGAFAAAASSESKTVNAPEVNQQITRTEFADLDGDDFTKGMHLVGRIGRDGITDTFGSPIGILGVGFKYQLDGAGWEEAHP